MDRNLKIIAKRIWKMAHMIYFMLRKGMPKGKLLSALNTIMRRGKVSGKEIIRSLIFHHHAAAASLHEYEFTHERQCQPEHLSEADLMAAAAEMAACAAASPALPGFGATPMVRQLRVTDSPFPLRDVEEYCHVDEAAEEFIKKFYRDLRQQNSAIFLSYS